MRASYLAGMALALCCVFAGAALTLAADKAGKKKGASASGTPPGMALIPGGEYAAGVDPDIAFKECVKYRQDCAREWYEDESPRQTRVNAFYLDKYEVTQDGFQRVMGSNPSQVKGGKLPVERVTWREADAYCRKTGKRLPTEWEWEKAARGGRTTLYAWGDDGGMAGDYAWYAGNSPQPVGGKKPDAYGLYDMAGNVWEWTASGHENAAGNKVLRGGSWHNQANSLRPSFRKNSAPDVRSDIFGFRCAK